MNRIVLYYSHPNFTPLGGYISVHSTHSRAAADPSITFPVLAGGATQDSLTTIRDKVSGMMVWSRVDLPPCRSAAELHFSERHRG